MLVPNFRHFAVNYCEKGTFCDKFPVVLKDFFFFCQKTKKTQKKSPQIITIA
jgi:hypothetical protein